MRTVALGSIGAARNRGLSSRGMAVRTRMGRPHGGFEGAARAAGARRPANRPATSTAMTVVRRQGRVIIMGTSSTESARPPLWRSRGAEQLREELGQAAGVAREDGRPARPLVPGGGDEAASLLGGGADEHHRGPLGGQGEGGAPA